MPVSPSELGPTAGAWDFLEQAVIISIDLFKPVLTISTVNSNSSGWQYESNDFQDDIFGELPVAFQSSLVHSLSLFCPAHSHTWQKVARGHLVAHRR